MRLRMRDNGTVIYENQFRAEHSDTSFPPTLTEDLLDFYVADPVFEGPQPTLTANQYSQYDGVEQINGKWFTKYVAVDYTEEQIANRLNQKRERMIVTPFQAKAALLSVGLLDSVEQLVASPETPDLIKLAWNNATEFRRMSPAILQLAATLNLTDEQLDSLFDSASKIVL